MIACTNRRDTIEDGQDGDAGGRGRAGGQHTTPNAGEPGVRLRRYLDMHQPISAAVPAEGLPRAGAAAPR
ncbi:hypothetical protein ACIPSA_45100 [Streptomyces sp. NPDC086549]|uniref:hypothetical protein n=1 Tax=Streptomyces sp. NPDC086549 TaxID=3365752 RepID=UPI00380510DF